jgi:hypothetical protein
MLLVSGMRVQRATTDVLNAGVLREKLEAVREWNARATRHYECAECWCVTRGV